MWYCLHLSCMGSWSFLNLWVNSYSIISTSSTFARFWIPSPFGTPITYMLLVSYIFLFFCIFILFFLLSSNLDLVLLFSFAVPASLQNHLLNSYIFKRYFSVLQVPVDSFHIDSSTLMKQFISWYFKIKC